MHITPPSPLLSNKRPAIVRWCGRGSAKFPRAPARRRHDETLRLDRNRLAAAVEGNAGRFGADRYDRACSRRLRPISR